MTLAPLPVDVFFKVNVLQLTPRTFSLKFAVTLADRPTRTALAAGRLLVRIGRGPVTKLQVIPVRGLPSTSTMPFRAAKYLVDGARNAVGSRMAVRVAEL